MLSVGPILISFSISFTVARVAARVLHNEDPTREGIMRYEDKLPACSNVFEVITDLFGLM